MPPWTLPHPTGQPATQGAPREPGSPSFAGARRTGFPYRFRQLTAMSPLQYQKWLRLNEAKRLMFNEHLDISSAAFKVGYESPSQFSREYSRLFVTPPKRDIEVLRGKLASE